MERYFLLFLISAIPAILGIRSGIKLLKTGHKILGGLDIVMSSDNGVTLIFKPE
jgi:hypothetical protein